MALPKPNIAMGRGEKGRLLMRYLVDDAPVAGCDFRSADLAGAELEGANLQGANLRGANLVGANLASADLLTVDLREAYLVEANLAGARLLELEGACLVSANLVGATLRAANLKRARLGCAVLPNADLRGADLRDASLQDARLEGADLMGADLRRTNLQGANLGEANLAARLEGASLVGARLVRAHLLRANLVAANLTRANLEEAILRDADLRMANVQMANLQRADMVRANLLGANLQGTNLQGADVSNATIDPETYKLSQWTPEVLADLHARGAAIGGLALELANAAKPGLVLYFRTGLSNLDQTAITAVLAAFEAMYQDSEVRLVGFENTGKRARIRLESSNEDHLAAIAEWLQSRPWESPWSSGAASSTELARLDIDGFFGSAVIDQLSFVVNRGEWMELWSKDGGQMVLVQRYQTAPSPARALWSLLVRAFTPPELERFITQSCVEVAHAVNWNGSREDVAHQVVMKLEDRGELNAPWFLALTTERPQRHSEVAFVASLFGIGGLATQAQLDADDP